jgi:glycosyltransferase involved in cell wall biosynthesis
MRILIAGQTYAPAHNGQAVFTTNLAEGLARQGHQVVMVAPSTGLKWQSKNQNGVQIEAISSISMAHINPNANFSLPGVVELAVEKIVRQFRPNIIHIQDHYMLSYAALGAGRRYKIRVVGTNHFMPENVTPYLPFGIPRQWYVNLNQALWQWMLHTYNQLDSVTGPSRTAVKIMHQNGLRTPAQPISCGVDLERFHPIPNLDRAAVRQRYQLDPHKTTFLFVGRIDGEKRIDLLLHAFSQLGRDDIQLAIAGRGAVLPELMALANSLQLTHQVHFLGYLPDADLPLLLNSADVFVMPSEAELLSIASLEAMACGLPVLLAHAQALPELVNQGFNGYLFEPGNLDDLIHTIAIFADHPERLERLGAGSLKKVAPHSIQNTIHTYENLYEHVIASSAVQPRFRHAMPLRWLFKRQ